MHESKKNPFKYIDHIDCVDEISSIDTSEKARLIDILNHLIGALNREFGRGLKNVVLHGSLAAGDFDKTTSDVDIAVLVSKNLSENDFYLLSHIHNGLKLRFPEWAYRLEVSYISEEVFYTLQPPAGDRVYLNSGMTRLEAYGAEWYFEKHTISQHGIVLYGPDLDLAKLSVSPIKLRVAAFQLLMDWWQPIIQRGMRHLSSAYLLYGVYTMCRIISTIEDGLLLSKKQALSHLIENNLTGQYGFLLEAIKLDQNPDTIDRDAAIDFIKSTVGDYLKNYENN